MAGHISAMERERRRIMAEFEQVEAKHLKIEAESPKNEQPREEPKADKPKRRETFVDRARSKFQAKRKAREDKALGISSSTEEDLRRGFKKSQ